MDADTLKAYEKHAGDLADKYESVEMDELHQLLLRYLPKSGELLEIGFGSGRETAFLAKHGYHITAVDSSRSMLNYAAAKHPEIADSLSIKSFPLNQDDPLLKRKFNGIICLAVLMHIPNHDLFEMAQQAGLLLKQGGTLILSFSTNRSDLYGNHDDLGRLYIERPTEQIQLLFERLGFRLITLRKESDSLSRDLVWHILVMENATNSPGHRSVDQIESVISKDQKDATYKLALLRALCAIAQTEGQTVSWANDGFVEIPLGLIAEKWLFYYWPIVALDRDDGKVVMPQKRGMEERMPIAFRKAMRTLIRAYGDRGLNAIYSDYKSASVPGELGVLLDQAIRSIANTIVTGPVAYTGGGRHPYFGYVGGNKTRARCVDPRITCERLGRVRVPAEMWREMCLIGQWIGESLILRWAELTYEITDGRVSIQSVIDRLLEQPDPDRDVKLARDVYETATGLTCVWTDEPLCMDWHVDHAVPFSVWHNNDLWNLFPCSRKANTQKSNKVVTIDLLHKRRENIIQCWELMHSNAEDRFSIEISRSLLHDSGMSNWESRAFNGLVENVETVAIQRGCERWDGLRCKEPRKRYKATNVSPRFLSYSEVEKFAFSTALPYVGDLAAGQWQSGFFFASLDECRNAKWLVVSQKLGGKGRFIIKVDGDSMEPTFRRGDLLVFQYHRTPRQDGQVVIALLADTIDGVEPQVAVKRIRQDRHNWRIISDNPAFPEQTLSKEQFPYPILGTYVGKIEMCNIKTKAPTDRAVLI